MMRSSQQFATHNTERPGGRAGRRPLRVRWRRSGCSGSELMTRRGNPERRSTKNPMNDASARSWQIIDIDIDIDIDIEFDIDSDAEEPTRLDGVAIWVC